MRIDELCQKALDRLKEKGEVTVTKEEFTEALIGTLALMEARGVVAIDGKEVKLRQEYVKNQLSLDNVNKIQKEIKHE